MTVKDIVTREVAAKKLRTDNLYEADEHLIGDESDGTPLNLHRRLAPAVARQLRFASPKSTRLSFVSDTDLDGQATRGIRELTPACAALLDRIIEITDRLPRSELITVTEELLNETLNIYAIAETIDSRVSKHPIGTLQDIRKELKNLAVRPGQKLFSSRTTFDNRAFHHGGRSELQFNIGREDNREAVELRHGVAFSFERSQTLPSIDVLVPKVKLFNDYILVNSEEFNDMRMWHYDDLGNRSQDCMPGPIPADLVSDGVFVFLGNRQAANTIDYEKILDDFDRLLPLYQYVESGGKTEPLTMSSDTQFRFKPGCSTKAASAQAKAVQKELDLELRHNELQSTLYDRLVLKYGEDNVGTELPSGGGTKVDVVVRQKNEYWFYEIKTALTPRACLRLALGQLFEYAFWPGAQEAVRLIVAGETALDRDGDEYLRRLRTRFSLPIEYEQIVSGDL